MAQMPAEITLVLQRVNVAYVKLEGQTSHTLKAASSKHDELPFYFGSRIHRGMIIDSFLVVFVQIYPENAVGKTR
jgi:hypothetical protein